MHFTLWCHGTMLSLLKKIRQIHHFKLWLCSVQGFWNTLKFLFFFYSFFLCFLAYYIWCNLIFIINWMSVVGVCTGTLLCDKASAPLALQWKVPPLPIPTHPPPQINQHLTECLFLRLSLSLAKPSIMRRISYILLIHGWDGVLLNLLAASINWVICNLP